MQPAVSVSWRGFLAAAVAAVLATANAPHALAPAQLFVVFPALVVPHVPPPLDVVTDADDRYWDDANALAVAIERRRWREVADAAANVAPESPHAPWVPAALELAVEQLDATAAAYVRMNLCAELATFLDHVEEAWPEGRAAMRPVACGTYVCGMGRRAMLREAPRRYAELAGRLAEAVAIADHHAALAACGAMNAYGAIPASCLVQACRAYELATAEVIAEHLDAQRDPSRRRRTSDSDILARHACQRVGVAIYDGRAHLVTTEGGMRWVAHPVDLVRVHPDAPVQRARWSDLLVEF